MVWLSGTRVRALVSVLPSGLFCGKPMKDLCKKLIYLVLREAKEIGVQGLSNIEAIQIVEVTEDALFCNAQNACEDTEFEIVIRFQRVGKKATHEKNHLVVISPLRGLRDRDIVFVYKDNGLLVMVARQGSSQHLKSKFKSVLVSLAAQMLPNIVLVLVTYFIAGQRKFVLTAKCADRDMNTRQCPLESGFFNTFQCQRDDRILIHPLPAKFLVFGNFETSKKGLAVLFDVEERGQLLGRGS